MNIRRDLWNVIEVLLVFAPFSLIGTVFGDTIRKDVLTRRQRAAAALFSWTMGPTLGGIVVEGLGWSIFTGLAVASAAPTVTYDVIALTKAVIRQMQDDPRSWLNLIKDILVTALSALLPWRK